ncbi:hypothetical protein CMUS01_15701, partial [Colletotrichum musicola]
MVQEANPRPSRILYRLDYSRTLDVDRPLHLLPHSFEVRNRTSDPSDSITNLEPGQRAQSSPDILSSLLSASAVIHDSKVTKDISGVPNVFVEPRTQHHQDYSTGSVRTTEGSSPVNGQYYNSINGNSSTTHQTSASLTAPILASMEPALDTAYYPEQILATTNFPSAGNNAYVTEAWDSNKMLAAYEQPSLAPEALRQPALTNQGYDTANYATGYRVDPVYNTRFDQHHETMARALPRQGSLSVGNSPGVSDDPQEDDLDPDSGQSADGIFPCSVCKRFKGD